MTPAVKKGVPFQQEKTPTEWELEGYALRRSYQTNGDQGERDEVQDVLESYVREGAQQMLAAVLEEEVNAFENWAGTATRGAEPSGATAMATTRPGS